MTWPSVTIAISGAVTDNLGRQTTYLTPTASSTQHTTLPSGEVITVVFDSSVRPTSVSNGTGTWSYSYSDSGSVRTTTVTDPNGHTRVMVSNTSNLTVTSDTDGLSHTTSYLYDSYNRPTKITNPEGDTIGYTYDARGNVTQVVVTGKDGVSTLTTTANYDTTCTYVAKCNQPNWTKDAKNNETDYYYNTTTGQVTSLIKPTGANGLRPETDYDYTSLYAYYKNSAGSIVAGPSSISLLYHANSCATAQTCAGTANDLQTTMGYGSSGVANNRAPQSVTQGDGVGVLTATTTATYDSVGNLYVITDPLGNPARFRFDTMREPVGVVGPDPDGVGPLHYRAIRLTYECDGTIKSGCDGLVTLSEQGWVASQSDSDWSGFTSLVQSASLYDGIDRPVETKTTSGSTVISVTQYSYDNANRPTCTALRMNPSALGSLPSSACTLGTTGSYGPDRITSLTYDNADRPLTSTSGYATTSPLVDVTTTYGNDNEVLTQADANGNLTTYVMDTFNRTSQVEFPNPSGGGTSSTTDYEQYTYDNNGNITQDRRRDGVTITYGFDALNLVTSGYNGATYAYDNLGRMTSASYASQTLTFGYDALSRQTSEVGPLGTVARQYDLNGDKTRLTFPDSYYVTYGYDNTGAMTSIVDSSSTLLVTIGHDDLGRRTGVSRASAPSTTIAYGSDLRLYSVSHSFADTSKNVTFTNSYNLAGQILSAAPSNTLYNASISHAATSYSTDGQNKYTLVNGVTQSNDARGNLSNNGTSFGYDELNRMTTESSYSLNYDAAGRLYQTATTATNRFLYDGQQIIAQYDGSSTLQRRFIPGEGLDESFVWYEGSGTSASTARWFLNDSRANVGAVATTGASNTTYAINTYDEYGVGGSGNTGLFQYKGMSWLGDLSIYYARARTYAPDRGRFFQSDPIGYGDGMNFYSFVHNDPVNGSDPLGLAPPGCYYDGVQEITDDEGNVVGISGPGALTCIEIPQIVPTGNPGGSGSGQQSNGRNCSVAPATAGQYAAATAESVAMTAEFFSGLGNASPNFGPGSATSQVMGQSAGVQAALGQYRSTGATRGLYSFGLSGLVQAGANPVAQFVGSFRWSISGNILSVTNTSSFKSLAYDHGPQWQRSQFAPMGNTHQTYNIQIGCH